MGQGAYKRNEAGSQCPKGASPQWPNWGRAPRKVKRGKASVTEMGQSPSGPQSPHMVEPEGSITRFTGG